MNIGSKKLPTDLTNCVLDNFKTTDKENMTNPMINQVARDEINLSLVCKKFKNHLSKELKSLKTIYLNNTEKKENYERKVVEKGLPTGLMSAVFRSNAEEVLLLIKGGENPNQLILRSGGTHETLINLAIRMGCVEIIKAFLSVKTINKNAIHSDLLIKLNKMKINLN